MREPIGFPGHLTNIDTNLGTEITWLLLPQSSGNAFLQLRCVRSPVVSL
jgi:hypothetical protein